MRQEIDCILQYFSLMGIKIIKEDELMCLLDKALCGHDFRIKIGITPTDQRLHLGHGLLFSIAKKLQEIGGTVVIVVADFSTSLRGIKINKNRIRKSFKKQISRILDLNFTEIIFQTDWTEKITLSEILSVASCCDVKLLLGRDSIRAVLDSEESLSLSRLIYLLTGAYDSVVSRAEVEVAGIDQEFFVILSRDLQLRYKRNREIGLLIPHLLGHDGKKMSKSQNNCIYLSESPEEIKRDISMLPKESIYLVKEVEKNLLKN